MGCDLAPNLDFKSVEFLFRVHRLLFRVRTTEVLYGYSDTEKHRP